MILAECARSKSTLADQAPCPIWQAGGRFSLNAGNHVRIESSQLDNHRRKGVVNVDISPESLSRGSSAGKAVESNVFTVAASIKALLEADTTKENP